MDAVASSGCSAVESKTRNSETSLQVTGLGKFLDQSFRKTNGREGVNVF